MTTVRIPHRGIALFGMAVLFLLFAVTNLGRSRASAIPVNSEMLVTLGDYVLESVHFGLEGYHAYEVYKQFVSASSSHAPISQSYSVDFNNAGICYALGRCGVNNDLGKARL